MQTILGRSTGWPVGAEAYADLDSDGALSMALGRWNPTMADVYIYIIIYVYIHMMIGYDNWA
jgi:hypothetical protein